MDPKASLAGVFAHELRNALSPARAALELLQRREAANGAIQRALRTMDRSFAVALQTIDRFVEAQRIMDGNLKLDIVPIAVNDMADQAIEMARPTVDERSQRVSAQLETGDLAVECDATRSAQVLAQLIENASVAAPEGAAIELYSRANGEHVDIGVRDVAPRDEGFDVAESLESMRAPARTRGLGLATASRLMELQHGSLEAAVDAQTRCAEFVMTLPRSTAAARASASDPQFESHSHDGAPIDGGNPTPQRILLVDDNQAVRTVYGEALEELGYDVTLAANGEDALRVVEGSIPEVALIDVHLPTLNGYQLARALRARHPSSGIKLVLLSGMTLDDDMIRLSKNAGFDHCVDKSAGPKAIDALLRQ